MNLSEGLPSPPIVRRSAHFHCKGDSIKPKPITGVREPKIRILIADDHQVVRQGIRANVKPGQDMSVVAEAGDGVEALARIKQFWPDVVLLDLRMPQMDGLDMMAHLKAAGLSTKVII